MLTLWALQMLVDDTDPLRSPDAPLPPLTADGQAVLDLIMSLGVDMDMRIRHPDDLRYSIDPEFAELLLFHVSKSANVFATTKLLHSGADVYSSSYQVRHWTMESHSMRCGHQCHSFKFRIV